MIFNVLWRQITKEVEETLFVALEYVDSIIVLHAIDNHGFSFHDVDSKNSTSDKSYL